MEVLLIFDVGKTHKKVLLFDRKLELVHQEETRFEEILDDEGHPCDDIQRMESWMTATLSHYLGSETYQLKGVNITTYGATLVYLDAAGKRLTPVYNYLKPLPDKVLDGFFEAYGGKDAFCRQTASPALGMLNAGLQILWLKRTRPEVFARARWILHLPQYLASLLHGQKVSEHTSIGCHTMLWDFDHMRYHDWLREEGIALPDPIPVSEAFPVARAGQSFEAGTGIHDSSASLAPYILSAREKFVLISTGTWCINMNPFNEEPLSSHELEKDCLCFLGVHGKPVKSSRFFLGRIHDANVEHIRLFFRLEPAAHLGLNPAREMIRAHWKAGVRGQIFFLEGIPGDWVDHGVDLGQFASFEGAYVRLMTDLSRQVVDSIKLVLPKNDHTRHLYITGGFARNPVFRTILGLAFPDKQLFTSEVDNASALGAALMVAEHVWEGASDHFDLGLTELRD